VRRLPGVLGLRTGKGAWVVESRDRIATTSALVAAARRHSVAIPSLAIKGRTLEDVFIEYTGRDVRDAADENGPMDVRHLYERRPSA
jgi:hypothetical protein